jgi:hypothetical protein
MNSPQAIFDPRKNGGHTEPASDSKQRLQRSYQKAGAIRSNLNRLAEFAAGDFLPTEKTAGQAARHPILSAPLSEALRSQP